MFIKSPVLNFMQICTLVVTLVHVDNRQLDRGTNSLIPFQLKRPFLWQLNVPGNNKTYLDLHLKFLMLLPDFNQIWIFMTDFLKLPNIKCHGKPSSGSCTDVTGGQTWQRQGTSFGYVNRPKNDRVLHFTPQCNF